MNQPSTGRVQAWRARWFGAPDHVAGQLRDIARQGSGMAHLAHACAFLLIVLFSAGSLVALGADALTAIQTEWQTHGAVNIPSAIALAVSTLLVLACDVALVYAASMLRLLATRQGTWRDRWVHVAVMVVVSVLEAATYAYMSWRYELPASAVVWAIIGSRALAAPLLSVYLSMARPLPVTSRDILYQAELAAGQGVIRDVVEVASDQGAPLAEKMALYGAAATMTPHDRTRLDGMIAAVQARKTTPVRTSALDAPQKPGKPPTGGGAPTLADGAQAHSDEATDASPPRQLRAVTRPRQAAASGRANPKRSGRGSNRTATVEAKVRKVFAPGMSVSELQKAAGISRNAASKWRKVLVAEATQRVAQ